MPFIDVDDVQQWLGDTKTPVPNPLPVENVTSAKNRVFAALGTVYDTSTWVDTGTTPPLVRDIMSMIVAGNLWLKAFGSRGSQAEEDYGRWLLSHAAMMVNQLVEGSLVLVDSDGALISTTGDSNLDPVFFPTDAATALWEAEGNVDGAAPRHFSMGMSF